MKTIYSTILMLILFFNISHGQNEMKNYGHLINDAENLFKKREYKKSAKKYEEAFSVYGGKGGIDDRYNFAKSYAMSGDYDNAFFHLFKLSKATEHYGLSNIGKVKDDVAFKSLHKKKRWAELLNIINKNVEVLGVNLDTELVTLLDSIFEDDQKYRKAYIDVVTQQGRESAESKKIFDKMKLIDSVNLRKVKKILDSRGWLGADLVGDKGVTTMFLVIQHADSQTQRKYLPMIREAFINGKIPANRLAYLEDRVAIGQGKKQIYGTQIGSDPEINASYVLPLIDPKNVDKRRATIGLETLQQYLSNFNITWNVEEYIEELPNIERKFKNQRELNHKN
ncbi:DUF6624 domain-containing protein [Pontimicrobium sp. SW4]|uniref:DUF6624 domain-containing protein n=1 Tax=Pontimicrobium sp. SW4 TaxID=3153519 RepID=A0AAU7BW63_9FLAO